MAPIPLKPRRASTAKQPCFTGCPLILLRLAGAIQRAMWDTACAVLCFASTRRVNARAGQDATVLPDVEYGHESFPEPFISLQLKNTHSLVTWIWSHLLRTELEAHE